MVNYFIKRRLCKTNWFLSIMTNGNYLVILVGLFKSTAQAEDQALAQALTKALAQALALAQTQAHMYPISIAA